MPHTVRNSLPGGRSLAVENPMQISGEPSIVVCSAKSQEQRPVIGQHFLLRRQANSQRFGYLALSEYILRWLSVQAIVHQQIICAPHPPAQFF